MIDTIETLTFGGRRVGEVTLLDRLDDGSVKVKITSDTARKPNLTFNLIRPLPADFGEAWLVKKSGQQDEDGYHVLLDDHGDSCTCWDGAGGNCRHVLALRALREAGLLAPSSRECDHE